MIYSNYICKANDSLNAIVRDNYNNVKYFNLVLEHNPQLLNKPLIFKGGEVIKLPVIDENVAPLNPPVQIDNIRKPLW